MPVPPRLLCPICGKSVSLRDPESPFCSPQCREIDLGNWATERYVISTPAPQLAGNQASDDELED